MAHKKPDNLFESDSTEENSVNQADAASGAGSFDIFKDIFAFSDSDIPSGNLGHVSDDLDLDSFLNFDNEAAPVRKPATKEKSAPKPQIKKSEPVKAEIEPETVEATVPNPAVEKETLHTDGNSAEANTSTKHVHDDAKTAMLEERQEAEEKSAAPEEKISFFAKLTPEKERFLELMKNRKESREEDKKELPKPEKKQNQEPEDKTTALRSTRQETAIGVEHRTISHRPKKSELLVYDSELERVDCSDLEELPETRDYLPIRFRRYGKSGIGGGLMYAAFVICFSIVLACIGWMFAADVLALSKDEVTASVVVVPYTPTEDDILNEDGDAVDEDGNVITCDVSQVAEALKDGEIIEFKFLFELFSKLSHAYYKIDPGTYTVSTSLDYRALVTEMQTGSDSQEITRITFPEGYTMDQMFQLLEENGICDIDELYDAAANHNYAYSWLEEDWYFEAEGDPTRLEGYLFPDTYDFYQGESGISAVNRFLLRFHGLLTQDMYQQAENLGITIHDAVIVASLVEKEAGANDDRCNFSSVIYNRLNNGWNLQLDSTINYIMNTSTFNISYADLETDSPYNTYLYSGLPKGAICNPGLSSLTAALQPNSTNYWYWYAFEGTTYFFTNSDEFNAFAAEHPY